MNCTHFLYWSARPMMAAALLFFSASSAFAQRTADEIYRELRQTYSHNIEQDPELERQAFDVHPDFEVNLFASSPWVVNPIAMAWDARGRLWVINSPMYPHILPGQHPTDFISVLEDSDDDGRADKCTVFYDKLYVPTGLELGDGGVYVANQPDLLFLKDNDGDLRADSRKILLSGFGTEDNHHAISAFTWCPGGWLYFESGIFLHTQVETPHGLVRLDNGGVFQFRPRDLRLELFNVGTATNPWGHAFDKWGQSVLTEGPQGGIWWLTPGTVSNHPEERVPQTSAPKSCGVEFLYSSHFSEQYQDKMVLNAFKNKTVNLYEFSDDGAGFATKELQPLLIVSKEQNFRPVDVKTGPDGALYIADFFQPVIGHMQYEFRDPRRDHLNGRVWRITQKGRPLLKKPKIVDATPDELAENLKSTEGFVRNKSRRQLYEIDAKLASEALTKYLKRLDPQHPEFDRHRLEALWTYQTIDVVEPALLADVLRAREPRARAAATRVLRYWRDRVPGALSLLSRLVDDDLPRVRLEAVCALSYFPTAQAMELAAKVADRPMDRFLEYSFRHTAIALKDHWLPALQAGKIDFGGNANRVQAALSAVQQKDAVALLLKMLQSGQVAADRREGVALMIAGLGNASELSQIFDPAALAKLFPSTSGEGPDPAVQARLISALARTARERKVKPDVSGEKVLPLLRANSVELRAEALSLAGAWKLELLRSEVSAAATDSQAPRRVRQAAIDSLAELGGPSSAEIFDRLSAADQPADMRAIAAGAWAHIDAAAAARRAAEILESETTPSDFSPLLDPLLSRKDGEKQLESALAGRKIHPDSAKLVLRYLNGSGRQPAKIVEILRQAGGTGSLTAQLSAEDINKLITEIEQKGDPHRGESVFRRKDLACQSCHAIAGGGPAVGPDLEGLGTSSPMDYLVHSVLDPNKAVREGFAAVTVLTMSGNIYTGILKSKTDAELVILDASTRSLRRILTAEIDEVANAQSIMPKGLVDNMTRGEFLDLLRFIRELGRSGPFATRNVPVIRTWRVLSSLTGEAAASSPEELLRLATSADEIAWKPAYSHVSGELTTEDLGQGPISFARGRIEVGTAGQIALRINDTAGLHLWVDDTPVTISSDTHIEVAQGAHVLSFAVDLRTRGNKSLRVFVEDIPGSPARARVVDGL